MLQHSYSIPKFNYMECNNILLSKEKSMTSWISEYFSSKLINVYSSNHINYLSCILH